MKTIAIILISISVGGLAKASLLAGWSFNTQTASSTAPTTMSPEHGSGSLGLSPLASSADANIGGNSSGTSINEFNGDTTGKDFYVQGGTSEIENGRSILFSLSTSGYLNVVLSYATYGTSSGFNSQQWSYSTDGTHYTALGSAITVPSSYTAESVDFSSVSTLNNDSMVYFELTLNGATGSTGADHFDNFQFNATPVPESNWGAWSGAGLLLICVAQEWRQHRRQNSAAGG